MRWRAAGILACVFALVPPAFSQSRPATTQPGESTTAPASGPASRFDSPARAFDFIHMDLEVTLSDEDIAARRMHGVVTHAIRPVARIAATDPAPVVLPLDAIDLKIETVTIIRPLRPVGRIDDIQPRATTFRHDRGKLLIDLEPRLVESGEEFQVSIGYSVEDPRRGLFFVLPTDDEPDRSPFVYTNAEPLQARYWVPCHDWPDERWKSRVTFELPAGFHGVSVGSLGRESRPATYIGPPVQEARERPGWSLQWETDPHLLGFAIGRLEHATISVPEIGAREQSKSAAATLAGAYFQERYRSETLHSLREVPEMIRYYESLLGVAFPYPEYNHVTIPTHFHGGMEHAGFSMIDPALLSTGPRGDVPEERTQYNYIAHMLAHMWFAGIVNYKHVREAWLNEGFATFLHQNWRTQVEGDDAFVDDMQNSIDRIARFDRVGRSTPLVPTHLAAAESIYALGGGLVYWKGAWVLHMLRQELGEVRFWGAVRGYLTHGSGSATTDDLITTFERAADRPLRPFFNQWVYRDGFPTLAVKYEFDANADVAEVEVRQTQTIDAANPPFRLPLEIVLQVAGAERIERVELSEAEQSFTFACAAPPTLFCIDPHGAILARIDEQKTDELWLAQIRDGPTALTRSRAIEAIQRSKPTGALPLLAEALLDPKEYRGTRQRAARALAAISEGDALVPLLELEKAADAPAELRATLMDALLRFPAALPAYAAVMRHTGDDEHMLVQAAALRALPEFDAAVRTPDAVVLTARAARPGNSLYVRDAALDVLEDFRDPAALEQLLAGTQDIGRETPARAERILELIAKLPEKSDLWRPRAAERFAELLSEPRPTVRAAAAAALGKVGDESVVEALRALAEHDTNARVRTAADAAVAAIEAEFATEK